jgi:hypothetical protein
VRPAGERTTRRLKLSQAALKTARSAALAASLVPLAQVAVTPLVVVAQGSGISGGTPVPEPSTLLLLASGAGALAWKARHKKQK